MLLILFVRYYTLLALFDTFLMFLARYDMLLILYESRSISIRFSGLLERTRACSLTEIIKRYS